MFRFIKQRMAIRSYARKLPQNLRRHFGEKHYYSVEEVTHTAQAEHFDTTFLAYAHAIFCSRADFDAYYKPLHVRCTYDGLRETVSRRFFGGVCDFDATHLIRATKQTNEGTFYESSLGS